MTDEPIHKHDCGACTFVGHDMPQEGEPACIVDCYICPPVGEPLGELGCAHVAVRRYSSAREDHCCRGFTWPEHTTARCGLSENLWRNVRMYFERNPER